jgi:hypothetical protein
MSVLVSCARLLVVGALAAGVAGCNKVQARTPPPAPGLDPPTAPIKLVVPSPLPDPVPPPPADAPAEPPEPAGRLSDPPPPPNRATRPPTPPAAQTPDPQVLRTTANVAELELITRQRLNSATRDLGAVRRAELGADGQTHFDAVRNFIRAAEAALNVKNYVLARQLADKAALLAGLLVRGRPPTAL